MLLTKNLYRLTFFNLIFINYVNCDDKFETLCVVNCRNVLHDVSDKFLSVSIDPGVLLAGMNLSDASLQLARHLSPAYIRFAGPSTKHVKFLEKDVFYSTDRDFIGITPSMWFGINEWLKLTGLQPIFALNDMDRIENKWNQKSIVPMLELSDKLNVSCFWQMGHDSLNKTILEYEHDLIRLHHLLKTYPSHQDWKIVAGDLSSMPINSISSIMNYLKETVKAFSWESPKSTDLGLKFAWKSNVKLWTSLPKETTPITFSSALNLAKTVGESAKAGFDVIFTQPRLFELFTDTPIFWFTFFHKKLMGSNVLDARLFRNVNDVHVFAHCTRNQKILSQTGMITLMVVNENKDYYHARVKINVRSLEKNVKVQEYVLTSRNLNSTDIFLNGKLLAPKIFTEDNISPVTKTLKLSSPIFITLPPKSIGFFVISGLTTNVCLNEKTESKTFVENTDINNVVKAIGVSLTSRSIFGGNSALDEIAQDLKEEILTDEKYYSNPEVNSRMKKLNLVGERKISLFNDVAKLQRKTIDYQRKRNELKQKFDEYNKTLIRKPRDINYVRLERLFKPQSDENNSRGKESGRNIRDINRDFLGLGSRLEESRSKMRQRHDEIVGSVKNRFKSLRNNPRHKRDINMDLLKRAKTEKMPKVMFEEKEATLRKPGQTSDEILQELEDSFEDLEKPIKTDIYAELAGGSNEEEEESDEIKPNKKFKLFETWKPKLATFDAADSPKNQKKKSRKNEKIKLDDDLQFLTSSEEITDIEEGLPCIHEYFGDALKIADGEKKKHFMQEFGEFISTETKKKKKESKKDKRKREIKSSTNKPYISLGDLLFPENEEETIEYSTEDGLSVEPLNSEEKKIILQEIQRNHNKKEELETLNGTFPDLESEFFSHLNLHNLIEKINSTTEIDAEPTTTEITLKTAIDTSNNTLTELELNQTTTTSPATTALEAFTTEINNKAKKEAEKAPKIISRNSFVSEDEKSNETVERMNVTPQIKSRILESYEDVDNRNKLKASYKEHVKEMKQKLDEEKRYRKPLFHLNKKHDELTFPSSNVGDILTKIHEEEREKVNELMNNIKKRLQQRKNEIDAIILGKNNEQKDAIFIPNFSDNVPKTAFKKFHSNRFKRQSVLDMIKYGKNRPSYVKPKASSADVLSMRREAFLGTNNDPFAKLTYYGQRWKRRSESYENELDGKFEGKNHIQNMIFKGRNSTVEKEEKKSVLETEFLKSFFGNVKEFFENLSRELGDYAKQLGILK